MVFESIEPGIDLYACPTCGAVVVRTDLHTHTEQPTNQEDK